MKLRNFWIVPALVLSLLLAAKGAFAQSAAITVASGAGLNPPADGSSILDPNVQVSTDGVNWSPAYTANIGYQTPFAGSNWDFPSPYPTQGWGDPEYFFYKITFVLPPGATAPSLSGVMSADDQSAGASLNGTTFYTNPYEGYIGDGSPHYFSTSDSTLFQPGTNVLVVEALNLGGQTAVDFTATVSFQGGPFAPSVNAGGPYSVIEGQSVSLDGSQSYDFNTPPQPLQYAWSETSSPAGSNGGQLSNANAAVATFVPDVAGTYTFNLNVTDSYGQTSSSTATIVALEIPPVADAGGPYSVTTGQTVTLDGTDSTDPNSPPEPLIYSWAITAAPAGSNGGNLVNPASATPNFTPDVPGTFTVSLTVTNSTGESESASAAVSSEAQQVASNGGKCTGYCQVAANTNVKGNVTVLAGGSLEVDGTVKGNVNVNTGGSLNLTGTVTGAVRASTNANVQVSGTVTGNLKVNAGDTLTTLNARFGGNLSAAGAASVTITGGTVQGNLRVGSAGAVAVSGVTVSGNLRLAKLTGGDDSVCGSTVGGALSVRETGPNAYVSVGAAPECVVGDTVSGNLAIQSNQGAVTVQNVTAAKATVGQNQAQVTIQNDNVSSNLDVNNNLSVDVENDTVSNNLGVNNNQSATVESDLIQHNLSCSGNASITALGDTINGKAQGQCKGATQPLPPPPPPPGCPGGCI